MKKIWKYPVQLNSKQDDEFWVQVKTKRGAKPLTVMVQNGVTCLWCEVDPAAPDALLFLLCAGTGRLSVQRHRWSLCLAPIRSKGETMTPTQADELFAAVKKLFKAVPFSAVQNFADEGASGLHFKAQADQWHAAWSELKAKVKEIEGSKP